MGCLDNWAGPLPDAWIRNTPSCNAVSSAGTRIGDDAGAAGVHRPRAALTNCLPALKLQRLPSGAGFPRRILSIRRIRSSSRSANGSSRNRPGCSTPTIFTRPTLLSRCHHRATSLTSWRDGRSVYGRCARRMTRLSGCSKAVLLQRTKFWQPHKDGHCSAPCPTTGCSR